MGFTPAICKKCGHIFNSNFIGGGTVTIIDCSVTCPKCGGVAFLPNGRYEIGDEKTILKSLDGLKVEALFQIAKEALTNEWDSNKVRERFGCIEPGLTKYIPKDSSSLANWLIVIIMFLQLLTNKPSQNWTINNNYNFSHSITKTESKQLNKAPVFTEPHENIKGKKRNLPCACGSGKKYKNCCGKQKTSINELADKANNWLED